ncbi:acyltransferase [Nocardioides sp. SOB77]|uniref:Acyltransferase n=1 Tax=Nocardioides oceani TaxID=3058369 RepID=A0ABT8FE55_9ACTN|nr:acyltransferase [Nocardioides oceani]MDN4172963.1 acyltransferase [Nocardioides oceani]
MPQSTTLGARYDSAAPNSLTFLRLLLALEVVMWHGVSLRGGVLPPAVQRVVSDVGVDAFFGISGFLICKSWCGRPSVRLFAVGRARRLLPGLWMSLVVTAFVIVPTACMAAGVPVPRATDLVDFVSSNATIWVRQWGIAGAVPNQFDASWNGSLWSLWWEGSCYAVVAALGVTRSIRARTVGALFVAVWGVAAAVEAAGLPPMVGPVTFWGPLRAGLPFLAGALLYCLRHRVRLCRPTAVAAGALVLASPVALENYRLVASMPLVYLCLYVASRGAHEWQGTKHDVSYGIYLYSFPVQQALIMNGLADLPWLVFVMVSGAVTMPFAIASWLLVERPALGRARGRQRARLADAVY